MESQFFKIKSTYHIITCREWKVFRVLTNKLSLVNKSLLGIFFISMFGVYLCNYTLKAIGKGILNWLRLVVGRIINEGKCIYLAIRLYIIHN